MKQTIGILLQSAALILLPSIVIFQLFFGFPLIVMPVCLTIGVVLFLAGYALREKT